MEGYIKKNWICPITKMIFFEPVVARDGIVYEKQAIEEWFENNDTSPITKDKIKKILMRAVIIKNAIEEYFKNNSTEKVIQYKPITTHSYNKVRVETYFKDLAQYYKLLEYTEFNMEMIYSYKCLGDFCKKASSNIQIHFIDNCIDIETQNRTGSRLLHWVCQNSPADVISHILGKNIDLNSNGADNRNAFHWICNNNCVTLEVMKLASRKINNLHVPDTCGITPFMTLCKYNSDKISLFKFYLDNIIEAQKTPNETEATKDTA